MGYIRILMVLFILLPGLWIHSCQRGQKPLSEEELKTKAKKLAQEFILVDTHIDVPYRLSKRWEDISQRTRRGHFDYPRAREGGLNVAFMSIFVPASYQQKPGGKALADSLIDLVRGFSEAWPDKFAIATSVQDVRNQFGGTQISLAMGIENGAAIEGDLNNLKYFYDRGIRYITLAHSKNNRICDSSYDKERQWNGLSPFGRQVIAEMNRLGIMIDVSHISDSAFYQVIELTKAPVIASHSSCRHFTPGFERNMSDEMIRLLAQKGGVIQINFGSYFIMKEYNQKADSAWTHFRAYLKEHHLAYQDSAAQAYFDQYKKAQNMEKGEVADVVDHIEHVIHLVGIDHVGLGSDFDGVLDLPHGLEDVSGYPNIIAELLKRGYSEADIRKICGENLLRVWSEVEKIAQLLQSTAS